MRVSETWTIPGAEGLPIHGNTHAPEGTPRAVAIVVHGWTGHKDRNINPAVATFLAEEAGVIAHRVTLSHAGVEKDGDDVTRLDEFERDSNDFCVHDVRAVVETIDVGTIPGTGLPLVLVGHSRGGATIYRCAAEAEGAGGEGWPIRPAAIISLSATATLTRLNEDMKRELEEKGYVEKGCGRAPGGKVRMGRSWYRHHLDHPERDAFHDSVVGVRCPTLIAHGEDDDSVDPAHASLIADIFEQHNPHVTPQIVRVPAADHNYNVAGYRPGRETISNPQARLLYNAINTFLEDSL